MAINAMLLTMSFCACTKAAPIHMHRMHHVRTNNTYINVHYNGAMPVLHFLLNSCALRLANLEDVRAVIILFVLLSIEYDATRRERISGFVTLQPLHHTHAALFDIRLAQ